MHLDRMVPVTDGILLLPELLHLEKNSESSEFSLLIAPDLPCFAGHFEGFPLVPGVVQIGWVIEFASQFLSLNAQVKLVEKLKFTHPILPNYQVQLQIKLLNHGQSMDFWYKKGDLLCSQGRVVFVDE